MRILLFCLLAVTAAFAQGTKADYDRALSLGKRTEGKVFRSSVQPHWLAGGDTFWYRVETGEGTGEFVFVDAVKGERCVIPAPPAGAKESPERLMQPHPSSNGGEPTKLRLVNRMAGEARLFWLDTAGKKVPYGVLAAGASTVQNTYAGHVWQIENREGKTISVFEAKEGDGEAIIEPHAEPAPMPQAQKPKPAWRANIRDNNIWLKHRETGEEVQLTRDGKTGDAYREPLLISPDGTRLVAMQVEPEQEHPVAFVESSPKDQVQPKLHQQQYLKPGDRIRHERPRLFDLTKRERIEVKEDLFQNPWDISDLRWQPDGGRFTFLYNQRGHQVLRIVAVDAQTGAASTLVEEKSETFVDYSQKTWSRWLDATGELLWASERDGWNHIYLFDAKTGALKSQTTRGPWVVRSVERVDEKARQLWLRVAGVHPAQDPYYLHLARVNFDGTGFTVLTDGDGTYAARRGDDDASIAHFSPDRRFFTATYSRTDLPPVSELRRTADGKLVCILEKADASALTTAGWTMPERFTAKGRDGKTDIFGVIYRPSNLDPAKKYPVVEEIYAGPHGFFVPKEWGREGRQHSIAELGFIVVQIDGMGTNWRSRAFHDIAWRNLKDAGFPDRIAWMKAAATTRPWMDLTRVGIYGGSAGGQNALAGLLHFGDFYKVGIADCGCHDNRMDKIWWNEAWLGEVGPWYADNSNVTHAAKLTGKLLLIYGELDTNVDPASTMQVVNALEKADKDFDLLPIIGSNHGAAESPYGSRRRMDFLVKNLLGVEPRK